MYSQVDDMDDDLEAMWQSRRGMPTPSHHRRIFLPEVHLLAMCPVKSNKVSKAMKPGSPRKTLLIMLAFRTSPAGCHLRTAKRRRIGATDRAGRWDEPYSGAW